MEKINIICVDDQREVLSAVVRDLQPLSEWFTIEECESADECLSLMEELDEQGEHIALVISDHVMPGKSGVVMLSEIANDARYRHTRKILLTGLASHQDTIDAINGAGVDRYFEKTWNANELIVACKSLLTHYLLDAGLDYDAMIGVLDVQTLYQAGRI
ncbi:response regulator [Echinimonas agarilytica]|uniref:Response regulator n=1 Tax=Echinimonas agarilytica TaxID=1215918 RepID=A0AA42B8H7_9GAMM|nr:response regulator [Echinimonas agarilytica]MCM2680246.1 response regulator [Echinimonas agarilytica]